MRVEFAETLYRTSTPQDSVWEGEFYSPVVNFSFSSGNPRFWVKEVHGWWDEAQRKAINTTVTLSPEEGFATLKEAQHMYDAQVKKRVAEGFKFSFRIDVFSPKGYEWVELS